MMLVRSSFFLILCCMSFLGCREKTEPINIGAIADQVESITVYNLEGMRGNEYTQKQLQEATKKSVDLQIFREIAPHARYTEDNLLWKGGNLAIIQLRNGTQPKIALSFYGQFFKILGQPGYYVFDRDEDREKWQRELDTHASQ